MRIPTKITLPFGYVIRVRKASAKVLADIGLDECDGAWVVEERTIWVSKDQSHAEQVITLSHEMLHAIADWGLWASEQIGKKSRSL